MEMYYIQSLMQDEFGKVIVWLGFILILMFIDILTGFIQAYVNRNLKSRAMSVGLLKKAGLFLVLLGIIPLAVLMPDIIGVSVIIGVYVIEIVNELLSIIENLQKMGVNIKIFDPIMQRLNGKDDKHE
ncbi:phage holin family protein [Enterococcus cecorum]|uniref:phage holin family protein n=1 Tax=Enterococcus cecorum TaxID=44008 RepID=UPI00209C44AB|nr:phage holin family protein [Enterococcus cecorum]